VQDGARGGGRGHGGVPSRWGRLGDLLHVDSRASRAIVRAHARRLPLAGRLLCPFPKPVSGRPCTQ
jgi:hypothetical protein